MGWSVIGPVFLAPALLVAGLSGSAGPHVAFTFADDRIDESSGLVDLGRGLMATTNDSGDVGVVYVVDARGRTVGTTSYGASVDAEALAPAGRGRVWVGDIGDNDARRTSVEVRRVPVGRGDRVVRPESFELVYPRGAVDAETLLADPRTGRLYIVAKTVLASAIYRAPARLSADRPNRLEQVGTLPMTPTDGAVFPDGRRALIRGYEGAVLYSFPGFRRLGGVPLPDQPQGESLSIGPTGRIRVGSEGLHAAVYDVTLPAKLRDAGPTDEADRTDRTAPDPGRQMGRGSSSGTGWVLPIGGAVVAAAVVLFVRRRRG